MKAEYPYYTNQKFFTPHTSVLPLLLRLKVIQNPIFLFGNLDFQSQVGGKKLVGGGKKLLMFIEDILSFNLQGIFGNPPQKWYENWH